MSCSRRGFLAGLAGSCAAAGLLPACAPDVRPAPIVEATATNARLELEVGRYPELAQDGGGITLRLADGNEYLVVHPGGDTYAVLSNVCTHQGCPLGVDAGQVTCPCHGARFGNDGVPTNPPAVEPLQTYASTYDAARGILSIRFAAGDANTPPVEAGRVTFLFERYPQLLQPGGFVVGVPEGLGRRLFVFALGEGRFQATDGVCTHQGANVNWDGSSSRLICSRHGSMFEQDGAVVPRSGPATQSLRAYPTVSDAAGVSVLLG
jgi:cytochrome b6-f complex iron-sulfur subunit